MTERALNPKRGPALFQLELEDLPEPITGPKPRRLRFPDCYLCQHAGLKPLRAAGPGGTWICGRGHGPLGPMR